MRVVQVLAPAGEQRLGARPDVDVPSSCVRSVIAYIVQAPYPSFAFGAIYLRFNAVSL